MLIDGTALSPGTTFEAAVCIVGTGMGAISAARLLVQAGVDVLFIEAGPIQASRRAESPIAIDNVGRAFGIATSRGLELGGGTAYWHGVCVPLDSVDFLRRPQIPYSGWPISHEQLSKHYSQARVFLGVEQRESARPQPPARACPASSDFDRKPYGYRSPPFRGKTVVRDWCSQGKARCVVNCTALRLEEVHGKAGVLHVGSAGKRFTVRAERFIIAAGALETPRLLLNSEPSSSCLQRSMPWWLGRNLIDHPVGYLSQLRYQRPALHDVRPGYFEGLLLTMDAQIRLGLPNHTAFIRDGRSRRPVPNRAIMSFLGVRTVRDLSLMHISSLLRHPQILWRISQQKLKLKLKAPYGDLFFMTEQLPNPDSRVSLSYRRTDQYGFPIARVDWRLGKDDLDLFARFHALLLEAMRDHPNVASVRDDPQSVWVDSASSGAHHLGTARMADRPSDGVVDADLKVFGFDNVWICDGSVFPTAGSANPSLTICALGHRLGTHLLAP